MMSKTKTIPPLIFITGTDTGAGKTVLTGLLLAHLRRRGVHALAMKPFISGGWEDAKLLGQLQDDELSLAEISPFFFPEPVAPLISARKHRNPVSLDSVLEKITAIKSRCEILLIEGIGGLRVPLGEGYTVAELIASLQPAVIVAAADRLGVINQSILTGLDLQRIGIKSYTVVLMGQKSGDSQTSHNGNMIAEWLKSARVLELPYLGKNASVKNVLRSSEKKFYKSVARCLGSGRVIPVAAR